jgi:hypothetical protein
MPINLMQAGIAPRSGAKASQARLNGMPVGQWEPGFQQGFHALVIPADDEPRGLDAAMCVAAAGAAT